ncbi:hypothetical protein GCM10027610_105330 [Dactylosporangium cerinum]
MGALVGVAVAGGAGAGAGLLNPWVGVPLAAVGALPGFAAGLGWDRRREQVVADERWSEVFAAGPGPGRGGDGSGDSVLGWLAPWEAMVPFAVPRGRYVAAVRRWCVEDQPGLVWLLSGGPGSGKTRLAMKAGAALRGEESQAWAVGWVRPGQGRAAIEVASGWDRPVLAVVDDADVCDDLGELLKAVHRPGGPQTVRVLLVAREFTDWWNGVQQPLPMAVDVAETRTWLGTIADDAPGQRGAARAAMAVFAEKVGADTAGMTLTGITAGTPLILLHAAALEAAWRAHEGRPGPVDVTDAVAALLTREERQWQRHATEHGLDNYPNITLTVLRDLLVFTMLTGARTRTDTHQLLPLLPGLHNATPDLIDTLTVWLHLYPRVTGYWTRPHLPAVFAEHLTVEALADNTDLAAAVSLTAATPEHATAVLTTLARAATHTTTATTAITTLLAVDPHRLIPIAIRTALAGHGPIDSAIATAVNQANPDWDTVQHLSQLLTNEMNVLNQTQIAVARARVTHAPTADDHATALAILAEALRQGGWHGEAVAAAAEAVTVRRSLAAADPTADPTAHQPYLAGTLNILANALRKAGRHEEAVATATEAVTIWRSLAAADPTAYQPFLADALARLADSLRLGGRYEEAITTATEAVTVRRSLAAADPTAHQPFLADALASLADPLRQAGRHGEAVTTAHQPYLADALARLADSLRLGGRYEEAITTATEAVVIQRSLAAADPTADPTAHQPYLADALASLANALRKAGRYEEAVAIATEAVTIWRSLAAADPTAYQRYLANALTILADALEQSSRYGQAVATATEAVIIWRSLAAADPTAHNASLADALAILAEALRLGDRDGEAVTTATEAVTVRRSLAAAGPTAHQASLANALTILAVALEQSGRYGEAVITATEAVTLYQQLGVDNGNVAVAEQIIRTYGPH